MREPVTDVLQMLIKACIWINRMLQLCIKGTKYMSELCHEKTCFLHMRKQKRRSAAQ